MNRRVPQGDILYKELWLCTVGHGQTLLLQGMILPLSVQCDVHGQRVFVASFTLSFGSFNCL
jgi:hypothetical protein